MEFEGAFFDTDNYDLTSSCLGTGSFGSVYVVKSKIDDKEYAAKIINPKGMFTGKDQLKFLRESQILNKLNHPAVVKFFGINFHSFIDQTKLEPTILTEYLPCGSLKSILSAGRKGNPVKAWNATKKYISLLGITHAMRYLHENKVIHRDLKPENVLMDSDYYPRVCDFGLSRFFSQENSESNLSMTGAIGTPLYMAPEILEGGDEYGFPVDVYSFGILAYEIVTGKEPFRYSLSTSFYKHVKNVLKGNRPKFEGCGISDKMKQLIENCWSNSETDRPTFGEIFSLLSTDFSYSSEKVDEQEVQAYLKELEKQHQNFSKIHELPSTLSDMIFDSSSCKIISELGRGILGSYHKAICPAMNGHPESLCTIKIITKKPDISHQKSLLESIECQSILHHEAIQSLIGFSLPTEKDDHYTVVTSFTSNGSLENMINAVAQGNKPKNWETIKAIAIIGIAAGMAFMHQHKIILADLRPESVFFDDDFHPKIGGFANSVSIKNGKKKSVPGKILMGITKYMAPEILTKQSYSNKIDVYAFAILLTRLLTLEDPYPGKGSKTLIQEVPKGLRPSIRESKWYKEGKDVNERCDHYVRLIEECWQEEPSDRPSFIDIVKELIEKKFLFFDMDSIDQGEFNNYAELVTKKLSIE